jgi:hypothetical protein
MPAITLQVLLTGPALGPHANSRHRLNGAAISRRHGLLLGAAPEALQEGGLGKSGRHKAGHHGSRSHVWRLLLQHGSVSDLPDERCVGDGQSCM